MGRSTSAEKTDAQRPYGPVRDPSASSKREPITISQPDLFSRLEDARDVARVVLAVAIHADDVFEAQLVGQLVSGLHAAAQAEMVRQRQTSRRRPRAPRRWCESCEQSSITSTRHAGHPALDAAHHLPRRPPR